MSTSYIPAIFGISGITLSEAERELFENNTPVGIILFTRNLENSTQVKDLTTDIKACGIPHVLIDQEGGKVARLKPPLIDIYPSARSLVAGEDASEAVYDNYFALTGRLKELGITVNCAPVLDLDIAGAHDIMGNRTFSQDPEIVAALGAAAIQAHLDQDILPVMKHIPGHGAATCDSHEELPRITLSREELASHFTPFTKNATQCPWAMTAHIVYPELDAKLPATQSPEVIRTIREDIGFNGTLITDALEMKALSSTFADRALLSLDAGCDAVLHCTGDITEMAEITRALHDYRFRKEDEQWTCFSRS